MFNIVNLHSPVLQGFNIVYQVFYMFMYIYVFLYYFMYPVLHL